MNDLKSSPNLDSIQTKYTAQSPLLRYANRRFLETIRELLSKIRLFSLLDAGCGEGVVLSDLRDHQLLSTVEQYCGLDIDPARIEQASLRLPQTDLLCGSLHRLPFRSNSFQTVLCLEVLEHVGQPTIAVAELSRVTENYLIASVPNEPWWRFANMLRGKYWADWGNTPEHINHWTTNGFKKLLEERFELLEVRNPVLWTFVLAKKK